MKRSSKKVCYGQRVRWKKGSAMSAWAGDVTGEIVPQPIGSTMMPPGGVYVLWEVLKEPMACFLTDLETVTKTKGRRKR